MPGNNQQDRSQQSQGADQARRNLERQKVQEQSSRSREKGQSHQMANDGGALGSRVKGSSNGKSGKSR